jgi:hypothetical protein
MLLLIAISFFLDSELQDDSSMLEKIIKRKYFMIYGF